MGAHTLDLSALVGGFKNSGIGRELGREGLEHYIELKSIVATSWVASPRAVRAAGQWGRRPCRRRSALRIRFSSRASAGSIVAWIIWP
ncbi:MAG: aldehyde dehydrogenase family protein [Acidimicrobiia bacterium]|nr:aldehyde dehydrogenase family protein [Acidimicrobiia bacterium]